MTFQTNDISSKQESPHMSTIYQSSSNWMMTPSENRIKVERDRTRDIHCLDPSWWQSINDTFSRSTIELNVMPSNCVDPHHSDAPFIDFIELLSYLFIEKSVINILLLSLGYIGWLLYYFWIVQQQGLPSLPYSSNQTDSMIVYLIIISAQL